MVTIPGGYLLLSRKIIDSNLMAWPSHYLKLWIWMLSKASFSDGVYLKRGQLLTSISEMQNVGGCKIGYRFQRLTRGETRSAYEALTRHLMITTAKTTRGMVITICKYTEYQDMKNYEGHSEGHNEEPANNHTTAHDSKRMIKKEKTPPLYDKNFDEFWRLYPRKTGKLAALKAWGKLQPPAEQVLDTLTWQIESEQWSKDDGKYIPHPASWLNAGRWEDEPHDSTAPIFEGGFYT